MDAIDLQIKLQKMLPDKLLELFMKSCNDGYGNPSDDFAIVRDEVLRRLEKEHYPKVW